MMSSVATVLIMLLTIASLGVVAFWDELGKKIKEVSEREYLERINGVHCPPLGLTDRFNVTVVDADSSLVSGCAYIQHIPTVSQSQLFHLWLRRSRDDVGGHCGDLQDMDHFMFECLSRNHLIVDKEESGKGWQFVSLFQHSILEHYTRSKQNESNRLGYRCALYNTVPDNPDVILMIIGENMNLDQHAKCDDLWNTLEYGPDVAEGLPQWPDGSILLILDREKIEPPTRKRSALQDGGCRFPSWSQGLWSDLQVYGNVAYYTNVFHEEDEIDDTQEYGSESSMIGSQHQTNNSFNYITTEKNIQCVTRNSTKQNQQQRKTMTFKWRCMMPVDNDEKQLQQQENGAMFLTYGGRIVEKKLHSSNDKNNGQDTLVDIMENTTMPYGCLWLESRGRNIFYSIIRIGIPDEKQNIPSFALELCSEKKMFGRDGNKRIQKMLCASRPHILIK